MSSESKKVLSQASTNSLVILQPYLSANNQQKRPKKKNKVKISSLISGALARILFFIQSLTGIILCIETAEVEPPVKYVIILVLGPQIIEAVVTLWYRKGREWQWVTPCILFHIAATAPTIWIMELHEVERRLSALDRNESETVCNNDVISKTQNASFNNISDWARYMLEEFCSCGSCILIMVQLLLLLLVVGRWLCPRSGSISMAQKATMLFHNFAVTSDILDLFRLLQEKHVKNNADLVTTTLFLWTTGIMQIAIIVTARKEGSKFCGSCLDNGTWAILAVLFLDDVPFLIFRFVLIIHYEVFSYTIYFFTCKNLLLTALNTNKLIANIHEHREMMKKKEAAQHFKNLVEVPFKESSAIVKLVIRPTVPKRSTDSKENSMS